MSDCDEDAKLFRRSLDGVRRLRHDRVEPHRRKPRPYPAKHLEDEARVLEEMMSDDFVPEDMETGEHLFYARPGLQQRLLRKLRRGQFRIDDEIDLHGLSVTEARSALAGFLRDCRERDRRCVRIIHGKGLRSAHRGPVLKQMLNKWLPLRDEILAFSSAIPVDGGTGALYVLLRRAR